MQPHLPFLLVYVEHCPHVSGSVSDPHMANLLLCVCWCCSAPAVARESRAAVMRVLALQSVRVCVLESKWRVQKDMVYSYGVGVWVPSPGMGEEETNHCHLTESAYRWHLLWDLGQGLL